MSKFPLRVRTTVRRLRPLWLWLLACFLVGNNASLFASSFSDPHYQQPPRMQDGWKTSTLEAEGIDPKVVAAAMGKLRRGKYGSIRSVIIAKNGKLVLESYHASTHRDELARIHSDTKSVASLLIGIAVDRGAVADVDKSIFDYLPAAYASIRSDDNSRITLRHVLNMTSGLRWNEPGSYYFWNPADDAVIMNISKDPLRFILDRSLQHPPGEHFYYNSGNSFLLSAVLKETTGLYADQLAERHLFGPLGITSYKWDKLKTYPHTGGGLWLRPRDMAKIGQMVADEGMWQGKRVLSGRWIQESTHKSAADKDYGYQWWLGNIPIAGKPRQFIYALGYAGQLIYVVPELDLVVVLTSGISLLTPGNPYGMAKDLVDAF